MKNNQLTAVLLALFFLGVAANVAMMIGYRATTRKFQQLQVNATALNIMQGLLNESSEYAKTHPDLQRVLQGSAPTAPSAPATNAKPSAPAQTRPQTR